VLDELGVTDHTIVVLAGDNGAENLLLARGSAGVFEASYFTSSEGGLRTPCLSRWLGEIASERASNEIVHQTDMFTTLLAWAGCPIPDDREIHGVDQRSFFAGLQATSSREGCLVWATDVLHAVKWQKFKAAPAPRAAARVLSPDALFGIALVVYVLAEDDLHRGVPCELLEPGRSAGASPRRRTRRGSRPP
jgi:sulfatase-like protein